MNAPAENTAPCALVLGTLFLEKPSSSTAKLLLEGLASADLPAEWPYGDKAALEEIGEQLQCTVGADPADLDRDYHRLFVGPGKLAAPPWGSVYLDSESVLFGDSCVALQRWMRARGIQLHEGESREPVDHIGRMLVLLSWLSDNQPDQVSPFHGRALDDLGTALFRTAWASGRRHPVRAAGAPRLAHTRRPSPRPSVILVPPRFKGVRPSPSSDALLFSYEAGHAVSFTLWQP